MLLNEEAHYDEVGVSFVAIFIMAYNLLFWVFGAAHSLSWDYLPGIPQGEEAERRYTWKEKPIGSFFAQYILRQPSTAKQTSPVEPAVQSLDMVDEKEKNPEDVLIVSGDVLVEQPGEIDPEVQLVRRISRMSTLSGCPHLGPELSSPPTGSALHPLDSESTTATISPPGHAKYHLPAIVRRSLRPLAAIITPVPLSIIISLPIALIQPLKALFVDVTSTGGPDWHGPDGKPPLAFVIDTGTHVMPPCTILHSCLQVLMWTVSVFRSKFHGQHCSAASTHHARSFIRAIPNTTASVPFTHYGHDCRDHGEDGYPTRLWHRDGSGHGQRRADCKRVKSRALCGDVSERNASRSEVRRSKCPRPM